MTSRRSLEEKVEEEKGERKRTMKRRVSADRLCLSDICGSSSSLVSRKPPPHQLQKQVWLHRGRITEASRRTRTRRRTRRWRWRRVGEEEGG